MGTINSIFAVTCQGGIGYRGSLPWPHNPEDLKWFQEHTKNQIVIMGRKTWDDAKMPKPLPNRISCIFTHRFINMPDVFCLSGDYCKQVLKVQKEFPKKDIFIIGGKELIENTKPIVDKLYITHVKGSYKVDTSIDLRSYLYGFSVMSVKPSANCTFEIYRSKNSQCVNT